VNVETRNRVWLASVLFLIIASLAFLGFYEADSDVILAFSSSSVEEIAAVMNESEHFRFVEDLGVRNGMTLFSFRWVDYTAFEIFSCIEEMARLAVELTCVVVRE